MRPNDALALALNRKLAFEMRLYLKDVDCEAFERGIKKEETLDSRPMRICTENVENDTL